MRAEKFGLLENVQGGTSRSTYEIDEDALRREERNLAPGFGALSRRLLGRGPEWRSILNLRRDQQIVGGEAVAVLPINFLQDELPAQVAARIPCSVAIMLTRCWD